MADSENLQQHNAGHFGFTAVGLGDLGATKYTLVQFICDRSGSTAGFQDKMEAALAEIVKACMKCPQANNLMIRFVAFEDHHEEIHGFKLLSSCNPDDYKGTLAPGGATALYDATVDGVEAAANYGKFLMENDYLANAFVVVITDGMNNRGKSTMNTCRTAFEQAAKSECLESIQSALIGVNVSDPQAKIELEQFNTTAGFTQYINLEDVTEKSFARLWQWISQSISSTSQALGSGGKSISVTF
jgi:uncharacterized protein YegL